MNTQPKRKPNSIFDRQVKAINSYNIGEIYKVSEMRKRMNATSGLSERVGDYHLDLLSTNCIKQVKHGYYQVLGHIPDFLTLNMCEANRGYTTYGPNPKYIGKSEKYGMNGFYDEWYINGEKPTIEVERGKKWKLGEPNPFTTSNQEAIHDIMPADNVEYWKRFEENNKLIEKILKESKEKKDVDLNAISKNGSFEQVAAVEAIIVLIFKGGKRVEVTDSSTLKIYYIQSIEGSTARVRHHLTGEFATIPLIRLVNVTVKEEPQVTKKEQIINILKQGLSASDAADLILNLF
jgi:hypothetical protein